MLSREVDAGLGGPRGHLSQRGCKLFLVTALGVAFQLMAQYTNTDACERGENSFIMII